MTSAVRSFQFSLRALLLAVAAIAACLGLLVWGGIESSLWLAMGVILLSCAGALVMAAMQLDRDVVHMAAVGTVAGCGLGLWTGDPGPEIGLVLGLIVGAMLGDTIREVRNRRLSAATQQPPRWWQRAAAEPVWMARITWSVALVAAALIVLLGGFCIVQQSPLLDDLFRQFMAVRSETSFFHSLLHAWYANALLLIALVSCWRVWRGAHSASSADPLLRRVAVLHCLALLLLSGGAVWTLLWATANVSAETPEALYHFILWTVASLVRDAQLSILLIMVSLLLLRRHLARYVRRFGWMTALGFIGLAAVACVAFQMSYMLQ